MKGATLAVKELEILYISDPKDVMKLRLAWMTFSSEISKKLKVFELEVLLYSSKLEDFLIANFLLSCSIYYRSTH